MVGADRRRQDRGDASSATANDAKPQLLRHLAQSFERFLPKLLRGRHGLGQELLIGTDLPDDLARLKALFEALLATFPRPAASPAARKSNCMLMRSL